MTNHGSYRIETPAEVDITLCNELTSLQKRIWGLEEVDIMPPWALLIAPKIGGILAIAYDGKKPIGLGLFAPAIEGASEPYLYLSMMGIDPDHQSKGIAEEMFKIVIKRVNKDVFKSIKWTYDPLEAANANLYLGKIGAVVRKQYIDYYGRLTGKDMGAPTDRFWAELDLINKHKSLKSDDGVTVEIPGNFVEVRSSNPELANKVRLETRQIFEDLFKKGYIAGGFYRKNSKNFYIFSK